MEENYNRIVRQLGINYFFSIIIFITSPFLTFLLTRHLSMDEFGAYSLFSVTISFLTVVLDMGLVYYIMTKLSGKPTSMAARSFYSLLLPFSAILLVLGVIVKLARIDKHFLSFLGLAGYGPVFDIVLLVIFFSLLFRIFNSYAISRKQIGFGSMMGFVNVSLWVYVLSAYILFSKNLGLLEVFFIWAILALISVIVYFIKEQKEILAFIKQKKIFLDEIRIALAFSLPLIIFQAGDWLIQVADRYILNHYSTLETVGVYNLGYTIVGFVIALANVLATVLYPYYSSSKGRENAMRFFNISVKYILMLVLPALVGLFFMRDAIITLISGPAYIGSASIIPWLILFPLFGALNILLYQTLMLHSRTKLIGLLYLFAGSLNICLNIWLVPIMGMRGAAISTTACYALLFFSMGFAARKHLSINWQFLKLGRVVIASAAMGLIVHFMSPHNAIAKIFTILTGGFIYAVVLVVSGAIGKEEINVLKSAIRKGS